MNSAPATKADWDAVEASRYCPGATTREWSTFDGARHTEIEYRGRAIRKTTHPDGTTTYHSHMRTQR